MQAENRSWAYPHGLISAIYDCIESDDRWASPLEMLRVQMDANVACLRISQSGSLPKQHLYASGPMASPTAFADWENQSAHDLLPVALRQGEASVLNWSNNESRHVIAALLERYQIASMVATCVDKFEGTECTLNCTRDAGSRAFGPDDADFLRLVGSHFKRAMEIRRTLTNSRIVSQFQSEALDRLGIAAILVSKSGKPKLLNKTAECAMLAQVGLRVVQDRLHAVDGTEDSKFQKALRSVFSTVGKDRAKAMLIRNGPEGKDQVSVIISPRTAPSLVSGQDEANALVFIRTSGVVSYNDVELLQQLFSFTRAEAHVAIGLVNGLKLEEVETKLNIRHNTARAHLRSIFSKADVTRRSELVSLLANSLVPMGRQSTDRLQ